MWLFIAKRRGNVIPCHALEPLKLLKLLTPLLLTLGTLPWPIDRPPCWVLSSQ